MEQSSQMQNMIEEYLVSLIRPVFMDVFKESFEQLFDEAMLRVQEPQYYTREALCSKLDISKATYHNWINDGTIEESKLGNKVLIDARKLDRKIQESVVIPGSKKEQVKMKPKKK